ncbi:MAG: fibronectin type III domain-containing protein, partial [Acidimicrobiia bacterium]
MFVSVDGQRWVSSYEPKTLGEFAADGNGNWVATIAETTGIVSGTDNFVGTAYAPPAAPSAGVVATTTELLRQQSFDVAVDNNGNTYVGTWSEVRKIAPNGTVTTIAGTGTSGYSGDGGTATYAQLRGVFGIAVDNAGNVYIADRDNHRVRKIATNGIITTIAGTGSYGFSGDGGPATNAALYYPYGVAVDNAGNVYIADASNLRVRKIDTNGTITTIAGNGIPGSYTSGYYPAQATNANLRNPTGVAVDNAGNVYIADGPTALKVSTNGDLSIVAGTGLWGISGDGGPGRYANVSATKVHVGSDGSVLIAGGQVVRRVAPDGIISTVTGFAPIVQFGVYGAAFDRDGKVVVAAYDRVVRTNNGLSDQLQVGWSTVTPSTPDQPAITGYQVAYKVRDPASGCGAPPAPQITTAADATTTAITGLLSNTTYCTWVRATSSSGVGNWSAVVFGSTTPGAPTISTVNRSGTNATLTWTAPTGNALIREYRVTAFVDATPGSPVAAIPGTTMQSSTQCPGASATRSVLASGTTPPSTTMVFPCLYADQQYGFRVQAVNDAGTGELSPYVAVPAAPTGLQRTAATTTSITVRFKSAASSLTISEYQYSTDNGTTFCAIPSDRLLTAESYPRGTLRSEMSWLFTIEKTTQTCSVNAASLAPNTDYPVQVRAVNGLGVGPAASITGATRPLAPSALIQTDAKTGVENTAGLTVNWTIGTALPSELSGSYFYRAAYGTPSGNPVWVVVGGQGSNAVIASSIDRTTWSKATISWPSTGSCTASSQSWIEAL